MKTLKKLLIGLLLIAVVLVLVSYLLPDRYLVQRSVVIQTDAAKIFPMIANLKNWESWSAWTKAMDPTKTDTFEGPDADVGATMKWNGQKVGEGSLQLMKVTPLELIEYALAMNHGQFKSSGTFRFEKVAEGTKLTWADAGALGNNPLHRWFGLLMDKMMGGDFQKGLDNLKTAAEKK